MSRRFRIVWKWVRIALILGGLSVIGLAAWMKARGPIYEGKPARYWIKESPLRFSARRLYFSNIVNGSNAVPFLMQALKGRDGLYWKLYRATYYRFLHAPEWLPEPVTDDDVAGAAMQRLAELGVTGKPAIPELVRMLKKEPNRYVRIGLGRVLLILATASDNDLPGAGKRRWDLMVSSEGEQAVMSEVNERLHDLPPQLREAATNALLALGRPVDAAQVGVNTNMPSR